MTNLSFLLRPVVLFLVLAAAGCSRPPCGLIEVAKIKPSQIMTGPYSFYVPPYSDYYFHHIDQLGFRLDWIRRSGPIHPLREPKENFAVTYVWKGRILTLEDYFRRNAVLGFLVLKDDQILCERYFHKANRDSRFVSMSMHKSFTSTLFGIARDEGHFPDLDAPITRYLPTLSGSGYNRVTLRQTLKMATGIAATENALDPHSSIHAFTEMTLTGHPSFMDYLRSLKSDPAVTPGTVFDYETVNTEALGLALEKATAIPLNRYMQEKLWAGIGAQSDAFLFRARLQKDQGAYGCLCATLRDYGRFGLLMLHGGRLDGRQVVSSAWVREATSPQDYQVKPPSHGGYGYQWWTLAPRGQADAGSAYEALGIFGQAIYIDPARHVVIVETSAWPQPDPDPRWNEMAALFSAVAAKASLQ